MMTQPKRLGAIFYRSCALIKAYSGILWVARLGDCGNVDKVCLGFGFKTL